MKSNEQLQINTVGYENTGGGCMVLYVYIEELNGVDKIGIDEEHINGYKEDPSHEEDDCRWSSNCLEELQQLVGEYNATKLLAYQYEYCKKYDVSSLFERDGYSFKWLKNYHQNDVTDSALKFLQHIDESIITVMDTVMDGKPLDDKYNFSITMNGKSCTLLNNADVYDDIRKILIDYVTQNG
jgi:hypothetical protein